MLRMYWSRGLARSLGRTSSIWVFNMCGIMKGRVVEMICDEKYCTLCEEGKS